MTKLKIDLADAKAKLSQLIDSLLSGEQEVVVVCRRNVPVAELRPIRRTRGQPRPFGFARGEFEIPDSFFDPLPNWMLDAFNGSAGDS